MTTDEAREAVDACRGVVKQAYSKYANARLAPDTDEDTLTILRREWELAMMNMLQRQVVLRAEEDADMKTPGPAYAEQMA
jgi:hypothetical protein